jgi:hypothetical protein
VGGGVHIGCKRGTAAMYWPTVPVPGDCEDGEVGGMKCGWQGKPKYLEKTCTSAILCHGGKPATNCLSYGAALITLLRNIHMYIHIPISISVNISIIKRVSLVIKWL